MTADGEAGAEAGAPTGAGAPGRVGGLVRRSGVWLLYATALTPLVFSSRTIYPYVVPRAVFFRLLAAGAAAIALHLVATRKRSLPGWRRDPVLPSLAVFVAVLFLTALAGEAPFRSLFGDMERMGGVIAWLHFLAFYAALRALPTERELTAFLWVTAAAATVVSGVAIAQTAGVTVGILPGTGAPRAFGTLGNPGYLAIYALFGAAAAALVGARSGGRAGKVLAAVAVAANASVLVLTWTRAALVGVAAGLLLGTVAYAAMAGSRRRRGWSLAALAGLLLVGAVAGSRLWGGAPDAPGEAADDLRGAGRVSDVAGVERGLGTRFAAWRPGLRAVGDAPLSGLGAENFRLAFDRHLDPERFDPVRVHYTRAHNELVESLVAGGLPGGLAWILVWIALFWALAAARRERALGAGEAALLGGTFVAYLVYLVFWFHDQNSLPVLLALAAYVAVRREGPLVGAAPRASRTTSRAARVGVGLALALAVVADATYHGRLLASGHHLLEAAESRAIDDKVAHYDRALRLRPAGGEEVVAELVRFATRLPGAVAEAGGDRAGNPTVDAVLERGRRVLAAQLDRDPRNPRLHRDAGRLYVMSYQWSRNPAHLDSAAARLGEAIALAPARLGYRHMLSEAYLMGERPGEAVEVLREGLARQGNYGETHYFLAKALLVGGSLHEAAEALIRAYELGYRERNPTVRQVMIRQLRAGGSQETVARIREARRGSR